MSLTLSAIYANCTHKANGCRLWNGNTSKCGYPLVYDKARYCTGPRNNGLVSLRPHVFCIGGAVLPPGHRVVMTCHNRTCLQREHMASMTQGEATRFAAANGAFQTVRHAAACRANAMKKAILDREKAQAILAAVRRGECRQRLADEHGIARSTVDQIVRGYRWAPVTPARNSSVFHQAA
jgi:hypothetical protein